ncbi:MAG: YdcF family protein [Gomphosphaeria aponina SAG 52.96 = DSM 107014]|uniref:YdcF family protein n=1 Tax=Gomphosphaeria aponina SAG 52.96 = DSM 107014 TaxID=1521640 RepID=A0A941JSL2_9CHRO|nr:YdcF family protein [Gomphosphaeria aponina SAG 52.96 = DSM 107014]
MLLFILAGFLLLITLIPLRLALTFSQVPEPQAMLVLGGSFGRMKFTAHLAHSHPNLPIWVSDYSSNFAENSQIFLDSGIAPERIYYDFCATDTVTNFTCNVPDFLAKNIRHLYLITSDYHLRRARAIASIILGSRGIVFTPIAVNSHGKSPESNLKVLRDQIRSLLWVFTGKTGASFKPLG